MNRATSSVGVYSRACIPDVRRSLPFEDDERIVLLLLLLLLLLGEAVMLSA